MNRYLALDAFRGFTIALMLLVITPGSWSHVYPQLLHAQWHGWTITDVVFPFFMFIIGSAMYFSFRKSNFKASPKAIFRIIKRSAIIFALGLALNAFPTYETFADLRFMSVLGRIGLAYGIAAILVLVLNRVGIWLASVVILLGYWLLLASVGDGAYSLNDNLVRSVDLAIMGASHMWAGKGLAFDPEGLLSTLPALVSILAGFEATRMITQCSSQQQAIKRLILSGAIALVVGYVWSTTMPINKYLWTSSYVLVTSAVATWLLALFIWLTDIKGYQSAMKPLFIYGMNPLFIYVFAAVWTDCYKLIPMSFGANESGDMRDFLFFHMSQWLSPINASLVYAIIHVFIFWLICLFLYQRKIVIRI
ncbi:DUF5009 domain-containing protein [Colwellia sp. D2M02]|uniref:acyltransferase family protein n=1 Tax=Colwellia sp. D2M02 TaxID=2841562 RepID=UPI001C08272D|nr:DUF5009 domain-containing protein [Colwellia sp. D2M02]MBU2892445.1 DUF5009 domain-containing protein [Colwellia sp. D2M02]